MHKNEEAKNYFTCNDTSIGNLGFIEFTDVYYLTSDDTVEDNAKELCHVIINSMSDIKILSTSNITHEANQENLEAVLNKAYKKDVGLKKLLLTFNKNLSFQDYIKIKTRLKPFKENISKYEFIFQP